MIFCLFKVFKVQPGNKHCMLKKISQKMTQTSPIILNQKSLKKGKKTLEMALNQGCRTDC